VTKKVEVRSAALLEAEKGWNLEATQTLARSCQLQAFHLAPLGFVLTLPGRHHPCYYSVHESINITILVLIKSLGRHYSNDIFNSVAKSRNRSVLPCLLESAQPPPDVRLSD
jgi:uncharacterized membrane protein